MTQSSVSVLVVDLDGTLLRSDMLFETFWSVCARSRQAALSSLQALQRGRAELKRHLASHADVDVATLPYDEEVIAYVRRFREEGGRAALVTATDQTLADAIAAHLDIFDEVHGSDGQTNLKGAEKASFLNDRYGAGGYAYMGDSTADLKVWPHTARAVTVNASAGVRREAEALGPAVEHLGRPAAPLMGYLKALRPHQWLKNILIFLPMVAAHAFTADIFLSALVAFITFSMTASSAYVLNDLLDLKADRAHPRKRNRPFAAGTIPIQHGTWMAGGLLLGALGLSLLVGWHLFGMIVFYYVLTMAYSLVLKRKVVADICTLAGLYTVRIVVGGVATGLVLSVWLLAFSIFLFFALAAVKRQAELVDNVQRGKVKASGRGYHVDDLPVISMMALSSGYVAVMVMALYLNSETTQANYNLPEALWGICAVLLYWITRTVLLAHRGQMHDDPVIYAVKDRISQICFLFVLAFGLAGALL